MSKTKKIILAGLLLAATIVLARFLSIRTPITSIGFSFIPITLSAMLLGPWWSVLVAGLGDLIGALLFPTGAFFPGYTLTAVVMGFIYGIFLSNSRMRSYKAFLWRLVVAELLVMFICSLGLNTLWVSITYHKAIFVILPARIINALFLVTIKIIVMQALHSLFLSTGTYSRIFKDSEELDEGLFEGPEPANIIKPNSPLIEIDAAEEQIKTEPNNAEEHIKTHIDSAEAKVETNHKDDEGESEVGDAASAERKSASKKRSAYTKHKQN